MKKIVFMIMIAISMLSCMKNEENNNVENLALSSLETDFLQSRVIQDLQAYNDSLLNANPETRLTPGGRKAVIAGADVMGLLNGWSDGSFVGFWAGWAFGNPAAGKIIGGIVGGLMVGAAYSVIASQHTPASESMTAEQMYNNTVSALIASGQLKHIQIGTDETVSINLVQTQPLLPVTLPENNNEAVYIGQAHNATVQLMIEPTLVTRTTAGQTDNIDARVLEALHSEELKEMFIENYNHCIDNSNDMSTGTLLKLDRTGKGGVIVDQYLQLHDSYVIDTDNSVEITNRYIQIVNSSDELTSEEKKFVNSALTLASYSTDLWTNL